MAFFLTSQKIDDIFPKKYEVPRTKTLPNDRSWQSTLSVKILVWEIGTCFEIFGVEDAINGKRGSIIISNQNISKHVPMSQASILTGSLIRQDLSSAKVSVRGT